MLLLIGLAVVGVLLAAILFMLILMTSVLTDILVWTKVVGEEVNRVQSTLESRQ